MKELLILLIRCMESETRSYCRLVEVAHEQMERLIAGREDDLREKNRLMEEQIEILSNVYKRKQEVIAKLMSDYGVDQNDLIAAAKTIPGTLSEDLHKAFENLLLAVKELKFVKDVSGKLIDNAIKYTSFTLTTVREVKRGKLLPMVATDKKKLDSITATGSGGIYDQQLSVN